jgi:hypothetical protein
MRRGQQRDPALDNNEEVDENFWASAAADRAAGDQDLDQGGSSSVLSRSMTNIQMAEKQYHSKPNSSTMTEMTEGISIVPPAESQDSTRKMKISGQVWKDNKSVKFVLRMFISRKRQRE